MLTTTERIEWIFLDSLIISEKVDSSVFTMYKAYKSEVEGSQSDDIVVDRCWKVFPNLREWCENHKLTLIECDLRWGVPKDSTTSTTIATCMEEIDRCYEENGEVFFLNMLGEKYGWIPEPSDLNEETTEKYSWIPGISITHMEILHGAYRNTNPHALFMLRSQDLIKDLPEDRLSRFQDSSKLSQNHLQVLKKKIREKFPGQVFDYDCVYAGMETTSTGRERVLLTGLERFEEICLDFFKRAFEKKFAKYFESEALTPSEQGDTGSGALCVCAPSGSGKSALLAAFANHAEQSFCVLYHDIGGSPESTMRDNILARMLSFLDPNEQDPGDDIPDKLKAKLEAIADDKTTDKVSVIILDGINQLSAGSSCDFLPTKFPPSVKCVLSVETSSHKASYQEVLNYTSYALHLKELCQDYQELLVNSYFSQFSKKLDRDQLRVILSNPAASSPLWLTLACHELRIFGDFRTLTSKIENLSPSLLGLLKEILNRLVTEDESMQMTQVLKFIYCSIGGLPESEIPLMLNPKNPVAPLVLANIRRQLKPFLRSVVFLRNGASRIQFFHDAMYKQTNFPYLNSQYTIVQKYPLIKRLLIL
ncbi:hypothetical protein CAPTEDRAFT_207902 [Capitella teleta]|uniref:AAA+ ATPase domain-containing protein n=1 Tax=Capitella teleta TaxID=283909 RepID=R7VLF8_CAPTE|nr:hypothetical protein CAPTEDRAFT_207902 [Capitella teleta]|eukprot:ELU17595.1 hypothetical protein CAPTEDRAFT_207902 [Capitella teleta]